MSKAECLKTYDMVELKETDKKGIRHLIFISYYGDNDLLEKYHIKKFTVNEAFRSTFEMIEITEKQMVLNYFEVLVNNKEVGYVITSSNHLYSFGVNIKYRTKEILTEWWDKVTKILGENFTCLLFANNTRAINYLQKRGMKIEWQNTEHEKLNEVLLTY